MSFTSLFLFFFGAIGVFNSFLISLYFIFSKKPKQLSNILFGLFLFFLSERALRSLIYFFSDITPNAYSQFGPITFLFIGPFLFLYIKTVIKPDNKTIAFWKYHILFWIIGAVVLHFIYPFRTDPIFYKKYILKGINIQWLIYVLISFWLVFNHVKKIKSIEDKFSSKNLWLCLLLIITFILWLIYFYISFTYFILGSITFSVIFYSFYLFFIFKKKERAQIFNDIKKYSNKRIENSIANQLIKNLNALMLEQKLYKNPNIKSSDIAKHLNISTNQFSQLLNDNLKKSFSVFINEFRIEEAKHLIQSKTKFTLDAIGNDSGFNSKSTFYTTFKKIVGVTPLKYKEQL